jgi:hypothetical protein
VTGVTPEVTAALKVSTIFEETEVPGMTVSEVVVEDMPKH